MGIITENIGRAAALENLAEECTECAHKALKCARILRGENPTPSTWEDTYKELESEFTDVIHMALDLDLPINKTQIVAKNERFIRRMGENLKCHASSAKAKK
jgi:NTP pyrophosphatase (non-canonical NTP hydrolase)